MNFPTAVKTCLRKYFTFKGRAQRSEFWYFVLFLILAGILIGYMDTVIFGSDNPVTYGSSSAAISTGNGPLGTAFNLLMFIPSLAAGWRRLHDTGRSGWWIGGGFIGIFVYSLVGFTVAFSGFGAPSFANLMIISVPLLYFVWAVTLIVFYCLDSHRRDNKYGPSPKYGSQASAFD